MVLTLPCICACQSAFAWCACVSICLCVSVCVCVCSRVCLTKPKYVITQRVHCRVFPFSSQEILEEVVRELHKVKDEIIDGKIC